MVTNTYLPHVGGVARSVEVFTQQYRKLGHKVMVLAPEFENSAPDPHVIRIPAIQKFNGSDFSMRLPVPPSLLSPLDEFKPQIIHAHHPFLLGDTALRISKTYNVPIVFTHHTMYEQYSHYVPGDSIAIKHFVIQLATGFANLCHKVFAPSESVSRILMQRGVETKIDVVPTGVDISVFANGSRRSARSKFGIPDDAFVVGHVGRLAPEKNLPFLAASVVEFLRDHSLAHFVVVGSGPSADEMERSFREAGLGRRFHALGPRQGQERVDAYHTMDVFAFASRSETQGMVLTEAMACGIPVVALDAPGARETVHDQENGMLLYEENVQSYSAALSWVAGCGQAERNILRANARIIAEQFSIAACANKALHHYDELVTSQQPPHESEGSAWETALALVENEWEIFANSTRAMRVSGRKILIYLGPLYRMTRRLIRRAQVVLNRAEYLVRLLHLRKAPADPSSPGLVLIQVDGLARTWLELALQKRRMPFLRRLINREHYQLHSFYSGLPSTTPAVQAELFYGVRCAVPAFAFYEHTHKQLFRMFDPSCAKEVEERLMREGSPLLHGGSMYSCIYSGGAEEIHYCPARFGAGSMFEAAGVLSFVGFFFFNIVSVIRVVSLLATEFVLAFIDCARGLFSGNELVAELKCIPSRVGVSVLLRELITIGATTDVTRGLPIVCLNFLGYDEQSHRRGPNSAFALWSLKGIDDAIGRVWRAAKRSRQRDYEVVIYSDHGQESTVFYDSITGQSIENAVADVLSDVKVPNKKQSRYASKQQLQRATWISNGTHSRKQHIESNVKEATSAEQKFKLTAMGPLGHLYFTESLNDEARFKIAKTLSVEKHVPIVFTKKENSFFAILDGEAHLLPRDAVAVFGETHPFANQVTDDLVALLEHPDSGDIVICGWRQSEPPISFVDETGAHGGIGSEETRGFVLAPEIVPLNTDGGYVRPNDLREAARGLLDQPVSIRTNDTSKSPRRRRSIAKNQNTFRLMTYNAHHCRGLDQRLSVQRIARVINEANVDIVALQELDMQRPRSSMDNQAKLLASSLAMHYSYFPITETDGGYYGIAILSRHPLARVRASLLPRSPRRWRVEPRGALWVTAQIEGHELHIVNTHLGLARDEHERQARALFSSEWLGRVDLAKKSLVLCGDFNFLPASRSYQYIRKRLHDAQRVTNGHRPRKTWPAKFPIRRIDHVFVTEGIKVNRVEVPRSTLARVASDHLPVIADLELTNVGSQ